MHEFSICQNMLKIIEQHAASHSFSRIKMIWITIGAFTSIEKESLLFCFPLAAKNTIAENAQLNITEVPGEAWCHKCQASTQITQRYEACSCCGEYSLEIQKGESLEIQKMEVE